MESPRGHQENGKKTAERTNSPRPRKTETKSQKTWKNTKYLTLAGKSIEKENGGKLKPRNQQILNKKGRTPHRKNKNTITKKKLNPNPTLRINIIKNDKKRNDLNQQQPNKTKNAIQIEKRHAHTQ